MAENSDIDILAQVESLFKKLDSVPQNIKEVAISKIREKIMPVTVKKCNDNSRNATGLLRFRSKTRHLSQADKSSWDQLFIHEFNCREVMTQRGRRAKQLTYSGMQMGQDETLSPLHVKGKEEEIIEEAPVVTEEAVCDTKHHPLLLGLGEQVFVVRTNSTCGTAEKHLKRSSRKHKLTCAHCNYGTFSKRDLEKHCIQHIGGKVINGFICQHCGKTFSAYRSLREHIHAVHERTNIYVCDKCGMTTYRASNLQTHIRTVHLGNYNNHVCPVCGAHVKQRNAFLEHMRSHTGDRPYNCDKCSASFACPARLTVHQKYVHGPRSFHCGICGKSFQTKHHMERHEITHTEQRPYSCPYCSYNCNAQGNMIKHVRTVHRRTDFSFRRLRKQQFEEKNVSSPKMEPEWVEKGQRVGQEYLHQLSERVGRAVTIEELREKEARKIEHRQEIEQTVALQHHKWNTSSLKPARGHSQHYVPETADHSYVSPIILQPTIHEDTKSKSCTGFKELEDPSPAIKSNQKRSEIRNQAHSPVEHIVEANSRQHCGDEIRLLVESAGAEESNSEPETSALQLVYHSNANDDTTSAVMSCGMRVEVGDGGYLTSNFVALEGEQAENGNSSPSVIVIVNTDHRTQ